VGKAEGRYAAVVIDANVVIAALIRGQGFNRYIVFLAPTLYPSFHPMDLGSKILEHAEGRSRHETRLALQAILELAGNPLPDEKVAGHLSEAQRFAKDPSDAVYVATALHPRSEEGFKLYWLPGTSMIPPSGILVERWVRVLDPKGIPYQLSKAPPLTCLDPVPVM